MTYTFYGTYCDNDVWCYVTDLNEFVSAPSEADVFLMGHDENGDEVSLGGVPKGLIAWDEIVIA